jgi:hypothetical protein
MPKTFTFEEANAALEFIRPIMAEIIQIRASILERQPEAWPVIEKAAGNGGSKVASGVALDFARLDALLHQILDTGAEVKDINTGLVDFRSLREGREVYLCWKAGEDQIGFWHDLDAGFAGRQAL